MSQDSNRSKNNFLDPKSSYHGELLPSNPNNLLFNANLPEFARKVAYICALESNGKVKYFPQNHTLRLSNYDAN